MKPRVLIRSSLRIRLMIGVVVPLVVILGLSSYIQFERHRELMLEDLAKFSGVVGDSVLASLDRAMLERDQGQIQSDIQLIASRAEIRNLMILDKQGAVRFASRPADVGTRLTPSDPTCLACHQSSQEDSSQSVILTAADGTRVFRNVTPIGNQPECQACHGTSATLNGVLVVDLPVEPIDSHLWQDLKQSLLLTLGTAVLVAAAINLLLSRTIITKLERFRESLAGYAAGDFGRRVPASGDDEIAELGRAINSMAEGLGEKDALEREVEATAKELERKTARLLTLYRVALESSRSLNPDQVMHAGLESALAVMRMEAGEIHLTTDGRRRLSLRASLGVPAESLGAARCLENGECVCGGALGAGQTCLIGDVSQDTRVTRPDCRQRGFRALAAVPLKTRGNSLGLLTLHGRDPREFSDDDVALLNALGDQLGIAIENARLYADMESRVQELSRQVQHLAVLEERDRLGREMHDGLAQALSLLNLKLQTALSSVEGGSQAGAALAEMREIVDGAYEDVRQAIGDLRTPLGKPDEIIGTLSDYVESFALRHDLQSNISVLPEDFTPHCAPQVELQVVRIVQEAMANVRKHAHAKHVDLFFESNHAGWRIRLHDDGEGFKANAVLPGHFGLAIMRERAASFGGRLEVTSKPNMGTTVTLEIPDTRI